VARELKKQAPIRKFSKNPEAWRQGRVIEPQIAQIAQISKRLGKSQFQNLGNLRNLWSLVLLLLPGGNRTLTTDFSD
jgi:hypothetical protein